jgi:hypothetical protein
MKTRNLSVVILLAMFGVLVGTIFYAAAELPDQVASHFGLHGEANGWMSKRANLIFFAVVGFGVPLVIIGLWYVVRYLPEGLINLPHREYWLAPERRMETARYMFRQSVWFASMLVAFLSWVFLLVVFANKQPSPRLSNSLLLWGTVCFLAGTGLWMWKLVRHFRLPSATR